MKKIISLLVCAAMLTMLAPLGAMAASNIETYTEDFTIGSGVLNGGIIKTSEPNAEIGTISVTDKGLLFTQDFTDVTKDTRLTNPKNDAKLATVSYDSNLTITTTDATAEYYYDLSSIASTRNDYSVEFDLSVSNGYIDLGLRYVVRIHSNGYEVRDPAAPKSYITKVETVNFTTPQKVKFVVSNKEDEKTANVSLYINEELVQENMPIPQNSKGPVSYGKLHELRIDSKSAQTITIDNIVVTGAPIDGNVLKMEKTGKGTAQYITINPSVADICNAKNYTFEFDFVPVGFSGSGQISLTLGAKYTLQANNAGTTIYKIKIDGKDIPELSSSAHTSMSAKSTVKLTVKDRSLVDLSVNGVSVAADTPATVGDSLLIQLNPSTTGTLYLDNFKLTLHDDYLLSADHEGENFKVYYYIKGAANLYKASYDGEGKLQGVSVEPLTASEAEAITVKPVSAAAGISSMRFFIWDNNLVPLVNSASAAE